MIGIIAVGLLVSAVVLMIGEFEGAAVVQLRAACIRVGVAMSALWFAYPRLGRLPGWLITSLLALTLVVAVRPRLLPLAAVLGVVLLIVRPRRPSARQATTAGSRRVATNDRGPR